MYNKTLKTTVFLYISILLTHARTRAHTHTFSIYLTSSRATRRSLYTELLRLVYEGKGMFMSYPPPRIDDDYSGEFKPFEIQVCARVLN